MGTMIGQSLVTTVHPLTQSPAQTREMEGCDKPTLVYNLHSTQAGISSPEDAPGVLRDS